MSELDPVIEDLKWLVSLGQRARKSDVYQLHQAIKILQEWQNHDKNSDMVSQSRSKEKAENE